MDVCRCCLVEGTNKNLLATYFCLGRKEVYSEMLQECFNISLSQLDVDYCNGICDTCIKTLRSSVQFKCQVLQCEQEFISNISERSEFHIKNELVVTENYSDDEDNDYKADADHSELDIKNELKITEDNSHNEHDDYKADAVNNSKIENHILKSKGLKKKSEQKRKTKQHRKGKPSAIAGGLSNDEEHISLAKIKNEGDNKKMVELLGLNNISSKRTVTKKAEKRTESIADGTSTRSQDFAESNKSTRKIIIKKEKSNVSLVWKSKSEFLFDKKKHRENLINILKYSNATPFKNKSLVGYICGYCDKSYPDPIDLRSHTEINHKEDRLNFKSNFNWKDYVCKLDISNLTCNLCNEQIDTLSLLKDHLQHIHNKTFFSDIKDHILQFKLKRGDVYDCSMCPSTYETFKMLLQHMNKHYNNYSCLLCDATFSTIRSLGAHKTTHQNGNFKCDHCDKTFSSKTKKTYHLKTKHFGTRSISNCPHCNEPFRSYYQRNLHLIKVHNSEAQYKCNVCDKTYLLKSLLMYHIKKSHLMERNFQCTQCGYKFFSKKALNAHMIKHTGERNYACDVCHKSYGRKYTLREHMRIHTNDRRFKCEVCNMTFVQKCSLKSHLLSNHGISMAASDIKKLDE